MTQKACYCLRHFSVGVIGSIVDSILLLLVLLYQGSTLDHYLIQQNEGSTGWYFWFLADFLILCLFASALVFAFKHNYKMNFKVRCSSVSSSISSSLQNLGCRPECSEDTNDGRVMSKFGVLPFSYLSWFMYASLLVCKIAVIFKSGEADIVEAESYFGATSLKVTIASAAVVFFLLVYCHADWGHLCCTDKKSSKSSTSEEMVSESNRQSFINYLIGTTVFELLDCVTFLSILLVEESKIVLTYSLENFILAFSCINFLLPTISLYKLSQSNFGRTERSLGALLLYKIMHLLFVNVPYLAVRIYLWTAFDKDVSLFIVKNILGIFIALRTIVPDSWKWVKSRDRLTEEGSSKDKRRNSVEMEVVYNKKFQKRSLREGASTEAGPSFHEINLNDETDNVQHTRLLKVAYIDDSDADDDGRSKQEEG